MPTPLPDLPVIESVPALRAALADHRVAVLVAPPGAGKTTVVPLALLDEPWLGEQRITILEPRRLATRAAAQRMAQLLGEDVGDTVGYQTRDERRIGPRTRIEVLTEGVLTRRLQSDPALTGTGIVVFDEVHERNLPTDLGLAFTLESRDTLRPELRMLAMSATAQADRFAELLGDAPVVTSEGRMFPVDIRWLPLGKGARPGQTAPHVIVPAVVQAIGAALRADEGDILVFLPGVGEIRRAAEALAGQLPAGVDVVALAGALSAVEQDAALAPSPLGRRRVVLSTDIAETSLTVAGVRIVIDAGLARVPRFDARTGMSRLTTVATSRASADQRAGRAGRTEPGVAYRLWSKLEHGSRRAHLEPEITQVDLAGLALELAAWGTSAGQLRFIDRPPARALQQGDELLRQLGAIDGDGRITAIGRAMAAVPAHPRLARMVVGAPDRHRMLACAVATVVDERDVLRGGVDELPADIDVRLRVLCHGERHDRADRRAVDAVRSRALDLARRVGATGSLEDVDPSAAGAVLLLGFPDRLAVRRSRPGQFQMRTGAGAWTPAGDPLAAEPFVVAVDLDGNRTSARIRLGAAVDAASIAAVLVDEVSERRSIAWDRSREHVAERTERRLGSMLLDETGRRARPSEEATAALLAHLRSTRLASLAWSPAAASLRERVGFLRRRRGDPWPDWSDRALVASLDTWLVPYLAGVTGADELRRVDLAMVLRSQLPWPEGSHLDELVPAHIAVRRGRQVAIDYAGEHPAVRVRVQDVFGVRTHPIVADGVPIQFHLLSPADRPIQVTSDLPGFWSGSWAAVRKDMAGRYPKHEWPADPTDMG